MTAEHPSPVPDDVAPVLAPPPLLFIVCFGAGFAADRIRPWPLLDNFGHERLTAIVILFVAAFGVAAWSFATLKRFDTPADVHKPTRNIVDQGPYRFSRNPLYLCLMTVFAAMSLIVDSTWVYLGLIALGLLLNFGVVRAEERYLAERFGAPYLEYRDRVRRWLW